MIIFRPWPNRILLLPILVGMLLYSYAAQAHSSLIWQEKNVHNYVATFAASADVPKIYAGYAVTWAFGLFDANQIETGYDVAYVEFSSKDGVIIFSAQLPRSKGLTSGTTLDLAMPSGGEYTAEVVFVRDATLDSKIEELAKASFNFSALDNPEDAPPIWANIYLWAGLSLALGLVLGLFGNHALQWILRK